MRHSKMRLRLSSFTSIKKKAIVILALIVAGHAVFRLAAYVRDKNVCFTTDLGEVVFDVCSVAAAGSLCPHICRGQGFTVGTCIGWHYRKAVVFSATVNQQPVVVKSARGSEDSAPLFQPGLQHIQQRLRRIVEAVNSTLEVGQAVRTLWPFGQAALDQLSEDAGGAQDGLSTLYHPAEGTAAGARYLADFWSLLSSEEYILFKLYEELGIFPRVLGTCGQLYVVEQLDPVQVPLRGGGLLHLHTAATWRARLSAALRIVRFVREVDAAFDRELLLCDVKAEHFGVSRRDGRMRFLDADHVYTRAAVARRLAREEAAAPPCREDSDCALYDCRRRCEAGGRCGGEVVSSNLETV